MRNEDWEPNPSPVAVEKAITQLVECTFSLYVCSRQCTNKCYNLSKASLREIKIIKKGKNCMVTATNKNLGPVNMDTDVYINRSLMDNLPNLP
jgi:hypothetical protein